MLRPERQVRAVFDDETIIVYQAYSDAIADAALRAGTFVPPFQRERMTWIKPSFLWMMYRCGWATKAGQARVIAVRITRAGFEEALATACLSHFDPRIYVDHHDWMQRKEASPVRVQWDPERDLNGDALPWRSLQVGIGGVAVARYIDDWIVDLKDITEEIGRIHARAADDPSVLPPEEEYRLPPHIAATIGISPD